MPALIPNPETYKESLEDSDVKTSYQKMPDGNIVPVDYFQNVKNGSALASHPRGEFILNTFGCVECKWIGTDCCPHKGDVTKSKLHTNRICSQRLAVPLMLHDEGVKMTGKQMLQVRGYMDADFYEDYIRRAAFDGKRDMNDALGWFKSKMEIIEKMRKQDEGSKLQVTRNMVDDLRSVLNEKIIDAKVTPKEEANNDFEGDNEETS